MAVEVVVSPNAREQIRVAVRWWRANREKAPRAFVEDLRKGLTFIRSNPRAGRQLAGYTNRFCLTMRRVRYGIYYEVEDEVANVLAVWQSNRSEPPRL